MPLTVSDLTFGTSLDGANPNRNLSVVRADGTLARVGVEKQTREHLLDSVVCSPRDHSPPTRGRARRIDRSSDVLSMRRAKESGGALLNFAGEADFDEGLALVGAAYDRVAA